MFTWSGILLSIYSKCCVGGRRHHLSIFPQIWLIGTSFDLLMKSLLFSQQTHNSRATGRSMVGAYAGKKGKFFLNEMMESFKYGKIPMLKKDSGGKMKHFSVLLAERAFSAPLNFLSLLGSFISTTFPSVRSRCVALGPEASSIGVEGSIEMSILSLFTIQRNLRRIKRHFWWKFHANVITLEKLMRMTNLPRRAKRRSVFKNSK